MAESRTEPLVSAQWVREHQQQKNLVLLDCVWGPVKEEEEEPSEAQKQQTPLPLPPLKHIPGSWRFDINYCIKPTQLIPRNFPELDGFQEYLRSLGVNHDSHVVFYDSLKLMLSARAWWMLRACGHKKVSVLDGGIHAWEKEGYDVTKKIPPPPQKGDFTIKLEESLIRRYEDVEGILGSGSEQIVDTRMDVHFTGKGGEPSEITTQALQWWQLPLPEKMELGHVRGARNIPFPDLVDASGEYLKSDEELKQLFDKAGVDLQKPITAMCYIGHTANMFSLAAARLGKEDVATYYGSWTEWAQKATAEQCEQGPAGGTS